MFNTSLFNALVILFIGHCMNFYINFLNFMEDPLEYFEIVYNRVLIKGQDIIRVFFGRSKKGGFDIEVIREGRSIIPL